jgi:hypothetical protein
MVAKVFIFDRETKIAMSPPGSKLEGINLFGQDLWELISATNLTRRTGDSHFRVEFDAMAEDEDVEAEYAKSLGTWFGEKRQETHATDT